MVLDKLSSSLKESLSKVAKSIFIGDRIIDELIKDIQKALLSADVNVQLVFDLTKKIKERALKEKSPTKLNQNEQIIKIVYEELVNFLGEEKSSINITKKKPFKIMLTGLYGSGKTTTIGKLAKYYSKRGYKVASLGLDVHRPAAIEQIKQVSDQVNIKSFINKDEKDPIKIYNEFKSEYKKYDILLIDTAGRDALSDDLIEEIKQLNKTIKPDENLLIISADIGQAAQKQAQTFNEAANITGVVVTKLDGTAKGGGSLSACAVTQAKIKFIGVGEKVDDIEEFNPQGFVGRILGMGDLEALLEKAKEAITEEDAQDLSKKLISGDFNFVDLYEQMQALKKMGPLDKLMDMVPGMGQIKLPKELIQVQDDKLKRWKFMMDSMTKKELEEPEVLTTKRIERIAKGSGTSTKDVRELIKQYRQVKKVMKLMKGQDPSKLMKKFQGKLPKDFKF